jgi:hypothetical protein
MDTLPRLEENRSGVAVLLPAGGACWGACACIEVSLHTRSTSVLFNTQKGQKMAMSLVLLILSTCEGDSSCQPWPNRLVVTTMLKMFMKQVGNAIGLWVWVVRRSNQKQRAFVQCNDLYCESFLCAHGAVTYSTTFRQSVSHALMNYTAAACLTLFPANRYKQVQRHHMTRMRECLTLWCMRRVTRPAVCTELAARTSIMERPGVCMGRAIPKPSRNRLSEVEPPGTWMTTDLVDLNSC